MKKRILLFILILSNSLNLFADNQEISGFFDITFSKILKKNTKSFEMYSKHYEFGVSGEINNQFSYEVCITIEGEQTGAEGLITYNANKNLDLHFGIFDIPYGIDYYYSDAPVNKFITTPNITNIFYDGGWTEYGILAEYTFTRLHLKGFIVNSQFDRLAFGTSIELYFLEKSFFEVSYNKDFDSSGDNYISNINLGLNIDYKNILFITEFTNNKNKLNHNIKTNKRDGLYFSLIYKNIINKPIFAGFRYNSKINNNMNNQLSTGNYKASISLTAGYEIKENSLIKLEYYSNSENILFMQFVVSF